MAADKGQGERVTLSAVRDALFRGDFEGCLALCDTYKEKDAEDAAEIVLLRSRCLIELGRGDHAIEALRGLRTADDQHDEYLTGRMLMSAAYVSLGKYDQGLDIARDAYDAMEGAHPTVRAEVALNLGIAHYRKGQYTQALRLMESVPADADIVYVRALQYRGGVAWAFGDFTGSLDKFHDALGLIRHCKHQDRFVEAQCLFSLAYLCGELPRLDLWPELSARIAQFNWSVSGVAVWRYWIAIESSFITELLGDLNASTRWARLAEEVAPDQAALMVAWCRLAARFGRYGEHGAHSYFTSKANERYAETPRDARLREQWSLPLNIAEELLHSEDWLDASRLVTYYAEVIAPSVRDVADRRRVETAHATVLGLLEEHRGNRARAFEAYQRAFEAYRSSGLLRHAAIVAYSLSALTGDEQYESFVSGALRDASETYWVKARIARSRTEARLTPRQMDVLRLVAEGRSNKEIAAARGIAYHTARNTVSDILTLLGVDSRTELARVATARGLLGPAK